MYQATTPTDIFTVSDISLIKIPINYDMSTIVIVKAIQGGETNG